MLQNVSAMLFEVSPSIGLPALAALILGESAGLPLPGETALIVSGGLAAAGQLSLPAVIAVATIAAIIGDMIGYTVGRRGGRKLLLREGRFSAHRRSAVAKADAYFEKYGVVTVFFARFVPGVRVVGAVAAGTTEMRLRSFAIANALGCLTWATTVSSVAYAVGPAGTIFLIVGGFAIAGIGIVSALWTSRREGETAVELVEEVVTDPLHALETVVHSLEPVTDVAAAASAEIVDIADRLPRPVATPAPAPLTLAACGQRRP